ncbi:MAG: UDP-galactopyranose mutase [Candidatus Adiutrix sp.]|jgi:UDP-galactopyranose mutase|nr:UDP-galactopyranose mutase [Candidatus Adiutrix sp.]
MGQILIVGAGLTGAALARTLAEAGQRITIIDERDHVAGHCHTRRDQGTGIMVHLHGAHIFHTDNERVWNFVNRFASFQPYRHRVKTTSQGRVYSLPVNLLTINQFFGQALKPAEAAEFIAGLADRALTNPQNFEEQALALVGDDLYRAFFYGYTKKQWGREPGELPASILKRLPLRFNYDDDYFSHPHQGIPAQGYTAMAENMLDHPGITVQLEVAFDHRMKADFDHVFYSGPLDRYFDCQFGRLPYRAVDFEWFTAPGDYQGCAVMNYADQEIPYTRIIEHKHFSPWETNEATICAREFSRECRENDQPCYPVRFAGDNALLEKYLALARAENKVAFVGRLGRFQYLDMDAAIGEALRLGERFGHLAA